MKHATSILIFCTALVSVSAVAATHNYIVTVDGDMQRMHIRASFGEAVRSVSVRSRDARDYVSGVRDCSGTETQVLRTRDRRILVPGSGIRCLAYSVDLARAARNERRNASLATSNVIVSPAAWFWRPEISDDDEIIVRFEMPTAVDVSVPWSAVDGADNTYRLLNSPESSTAFAAFGQFEFRETNIPGGKLRVTMMQPQRNVQVAPLYEWVRDTATTVTLAYGRFPNPDVSVVIVPIGNRGWGDDAVTFGRVVRDGGESIELFVNPARPIEEFYDSWTATHEFSHLMLPYIWERHRWVSEGFASYYQNVLMARSGRYTEERAWQKLWEGFDRGMASRPDMSMNDAADGGGRATTMKVYWSGAAIALMADVELRRRSGGAESLDTVLDRLQQCCIPSDRTWSGPELFTKLDTLLDAPLFMPLYRRHANSAGFPDAHGLLEKLGVDYRRREVRLRDTADLARIRAAIMQKT
jgi:hypothetical protein